MYTAPPDSGSPASINNADDIEASTQAVWEHVRETQMLQDYHGVLVACYSSHPLVGIIAAHYPGLSVTGIFEASVVATLPLLRRTGLDVDDTGGWGIVTTGQFWHDHLSSAVHHFLGQETGRANRWFRGVFTTGLNASDFHGRVSPDTMRDRLTQATTRLLQSGMVDCVIVGCAGMAGLENIIRAAVKAEYGELQASNVYIIDGVCAGVRVIHDMVRNRRMFLPQ